MSAAQLKAGPINPRAGKVHAVRLPSGPPFVGRSRRGYLILECSGRAMSGLFTVGPDEPITCAACTRRGYA